MGDNWTHLHNGALVHDPAACAHHVSAISTHDDNATSFAPVVASNMSGGYSLPYILFVSIAVCLVILLVILGNTLVIVAIAVDKSLKHLQNWLIASLAASDLLLGVLIMPLSLANELMGYWVFGHVLCAFWLITDVFLCTASILNLCLISVDRYMSITRVAYARQRTPRKSAIMIAVVWLLSVAICFPPLVGWKRPQPTTDLGQPLCVLSEEVGYVIYSTLGSFYAPLIVIVVVYFKIYVTVRAQARRSLRNKRAARGAIPSTNVVCRGGAPVSDLSRPLTPAGRGSSLDDSSPSREERVDSPRQDNTSSSEKYTFCNNHTTKRNSASDAKEDTSLSEYLSNADSSKPKEKRSSGCDDVTTGCNGQEPGKDRTSFASNPSDGIGPRNGGTTTTTTTISNSGGQRTVPRPLYLMRTLSTRRSVKHKSSTFGCSFRSDADRLKRKLARARERRATVVLGIILTTFICCWLPFFSTYLVSSLTGMHVHARVFAIFFWIGYCNSALNPIIYTIFNRDFRLAFERLVCRKHTSDVA